MQPINLYSIVLASILLSCNFAVPEERDATSISNANSRITQEVKIVETSYIDTTKNTIATRFPVSSGFARTVVDTTTFGYYLRHLPLKEHGAEVQLYTGGVKKDRGVYLAVVDKEIGNKDLHQCADAVMRLRADYLFSRKDYDAIHFNFTNGFSAEYSKWREGNRIVVRGNKVSWVNRATPSDSPDSYWRYLEQVFMYAGTLSLDKELKQVSLEEMKIGDVFIWGGSPGHAIIIVDMIKNENTGEIKFMLAQSYMPAQEIQVLRNPANKDPDNPWYSFSSGESLNTPEWDFDSNQLKRFAE